MPSPKRLGAVTIALVALWAFGLGLGRRHTQQPAPSAEAYEPSGWVESLGRLLAPLAPAVDLDRLRSSCRRTENVFWLSETNTSCVIQIPAAEERYRNLSLRLQETGSEVTVDYAPGGNGDPQGHILTGEEPLRTVVLREGGTLTLRCNPCPAGVR